MKIPPYKNITEILANSRLAQIVERSNLINGLNRQIQQMLPSQYRPFFRIINLYEDLLVIEVPNAVIRQGLLLQQAALLARIQADFPQITQLEFKLNPNFRAV